MLTDEESHGQKLQYRTLLQADALKVYYKDTGMELSI